MGHPLLPRHTAPSIRLKLNRIELARPRQWGACRLALELWNHLRLAAKDTLYRCHDLLLDRRKDLFSQLRDMLGKITAQYGKERRPWIMD